MTNARPEGFSADGGASSITGLLADTWRSRRLIVMLSRKDFYVQYRRASLGMVWAVGLPLIQAAVLSIVFTRIVRFQVQGHYPTFLFAGILPWTFFNAAIGAGTTSIVDGSQLATKVYFPRMILPLVVIGTGFYGFLPGLAVLVAMVVVFPVALGPHLLWLVPGVALMLALSVAFALLLSAAYVYFRDLRYIVQASLLAWFWVSPVVYPLDKAPGGLRTLIEINPVSGMLELFRAGTVGAPNGWDTTVYWSIGWTLVLATAGVLLHRRLDRVFVDLL
jgi:lipopolysaccharide transport system permease protein